MNFDFNQQYKDYSNIDLLKIVKRPNDYQPTAVAVATQILNARQVTSEEILLVDQYFQDIDNSIKDRKEIIDAYNNKTVDFLEPVINPSEKVEPAKWMNILLLVIALQYAWKLLNTTKHLLNFLQCDNCALDIVFFTELLTLLYIPLIFFLLYHKTRWGWIFLFADNLFTIISTLGTSYIFFKYQDIHHGDTSSFLMPVFIKTAIAIFLWRDAIASSFGVVYETKKKTAIITTILTLLFMLLMYLLYGL